jgi:HD superfamily phosphohydrolase
VANGKNGLDVDKFDYLPRDARMCGISIGLNVNRLMQFSKVHKPPCRHLGSSLTPIGIVSVGRQIFALLGSYLAPPQSESTILVRLHLFGSTFSAFQHWLILQVIDNEICYKWSEYHNVKQVYQTRLEMHQRVYGHRRVTLRASNLSHRAGGNACYSSQRTMYKQNPWNPFSLPPGAFIETKPNA